ncbi:MAG: hypothetical protein AAF357_12975 [Verrucomicrobiota bacterium]
MTTSRANYQKALDRATEPIHEKYLQHLKRLQGEFTRKNELDAALAIRSEIEALEDIMKDGGTMVMRSIEERSSESDDLLEWLQGREFRWEGTSAKEVSMHFKGDKVRVEADGREIMEKKIEVVSPTVFQFEWSGDDLNTFTIATGKREFTRFMEKSRSTHGGEIRAKSNL